MSSVTKNVCRNKRKSSTFKQAWMRKDLYILTEKLSQAHTFNEKLQTKYRSDRHYVSVQISNVKTDYFKQEFLTCKDNQIQKWNFIKKILNRKKTDDNQINRK